MLSHTAKTTFPNAKVVYNDFDNFQKRLKNIANTNAILEELRALRLTTPRDNKITGDERELVLNVLRKADRHGWVDWVSLSASLRFSMNYGFSLEDFIDNTLYNVLRKSNYPTASDYLKDVEITRLDYKILFAKYKDLDNVVFLVDPPYLSTDSATYSNDEYWQLRDYLDVLQVLQDNSYFYFTSDKSQIVELCEWVSSVSVSANPFENATKIEVSVSVNHISKYVDIMYHLKK